MSFAQRLRQARKAAGLTQAQLAAAFNKKSQSVNQWESAKHWPEHDNLVRLAEVLDVSLDWLFTGHGPGPGERGAPAPQYSGPSIPLENFAERLRVSRRDKAKMEPSEAARATGIPLPRYEAIEAGRVHPTIDELLAIAQGLDVSLNLLIAGEGLPGLREAITPPEIQPTIHETPFGFRPKGRGNTRDNEA